MSLSTRLSPPSWTGYVTYIIIFLWQLDHRSEQRTSNTTRGKAMTSRCSAASRWTTQPGTRSPTTGYAAPPAGTRMSPSETYPWKRIMSKWGIPVVHIVICLFSLISSTILIIYLLCQHSEDPSHLFISNWFNKIDC